MLAWPALVAARLLGLPRRAMSLPAVCALSACIVVLAWAIATSWHDVHRYAGTDLRARVVGARLLAAGESPYFTLQESSTPEAFVDPDRYYTSVTRCTYTPALLALYLPFAAMPYPDQRVLWLVLEWCAFVASVVLLTRSIPGSRAKLAFAATALVFFAGDWSMRLHVERGQYYVFLLLLSALAIFLGIGASSRGDRFIGGLPLGVAAALRPSFVVAAVALSCLRQWRTCAGMALGAALAVVVTLPIAGASSWPEFFRLSEAYEVSRVEGPGAMDPPGAPYVYPGRRPSGGDRVVVDGADFTERLPAKSTTVTLFSAYNRAPAMLRALVPPQRVPGLARAVALVVCALAAVLCLRARRPMNLRHALGCCFALALAIEYCLPVRFSYADPLYLAPLAVFTPRMIRGRCRAFAVALTLAMASSLLMPSNATSALRSLSLLAAVCGSALVVLNVPRAAPPTLDG